MNRKLVSTQTITMIEPIPGADRIMLAHVLGWKVIISKDMHLAVGDKVAYFETDSLLPETDPRYAQFMPRGIRHMTIIDPATGGPVEVSGHVLRTMKMRGVYSQGLIMALDELGIDPTLPVGTDITEACHVIKYEPPVFANTGSRQDKAAQRAAQGIIGDFNAPCAKSDAPRAQTLTGIWDELCTLQATPTVKVDGTSTTLYRDHDGDSHVYSRNWELNTDSMNADTARQYGLWDALKPGMCIQFELAGPGINNNRQRLQTPEPFVFAVWQDGGKLSRDEWPEPCLEHAAPDTNRWEYPLTADMDTLIDAVDGMRGHITPNTLDEGIVWHLDPNQTIPDSVREALGDNLCFKIINNTYLTKHHL